LKRELKRQIKQDEFVSGLEHAVSWTKAHASEVRLGAAIAAVVIALAGGFIYLQRSRERAAEEAFASALEIFEAPVAGEAAAGEPKPTGVTFATAEEKYKKAAAAFDGVERAYPSLTAGIRARYYGALARIEVGDKTAEEMLSGIAALDASKSLEPALARLALADLHRRTGALDKAVESYRKLIDDASFPLPRDYALMRLASTLEEARRTDEARSAYRRLTDEFPDSVYAPDARRKAEYLGAVAQG
jgi:tetratricopeptide (TPR) repeat protein